MHAQIFAHFISNILLFAENVNGANTAGADESIDQHYAPTVPRCDHQMTKCDV